ncbi:MAG: RsmB/NOP family class I SAM-dependent RNA methyltransferase [Bdellovibrionia bacterium]
MSETGGPIRKLARKIFESVEEQEAFVNAVNEPPEHPPTVLSLTDDILPWKILESANGVPEFVFRFPVGSEPSRNPLHDNGAYYCLDYSSAIMASVLLGVPREPEVVLDACAAPGGKSVFVSRALEPKYLISNELVIGRAKALISNLKRCAIPNAMVFNFSADTLGKHLAGACDLIILDVPCSGQSLMVKGQNVSGTFRDHVVSGNVKRQRGILARLAPCVRGGGYIAYMTCTFAPDENEKNLVWFMKRFPNFEAIEVPALAEFKSHLSDFPSYRVWPHRTPAAGGFAALLKNKEEASASSTFDPRDFSPIWKS